mgnify:CR=1 FL=1
MAGYLEIINTSNNQRFTDAKENDLAFLVDSSNQSILFGINQGSNSTLRLTNSNLNLQGDLVIAGGLAPRGIKIMQTQPGAAPTNISTSTVGAIAGLSTYSLTNYRFTLSNSQTDFRFVSAAGSNNLVLTSASQLQAATTDTSNAPAYSWQGDTTTGVYHSTAGQVGIACSGVPAATFNSNSAVFGSALQPSYLCAGNLGMFRNRIINGDMRIAQRGPSNIIGTGTNSAYCVDRWKIDASITTGGVTQSNVVLTSSDTPFQYGFKNSLRITASTANTSYSYINTSQNIEGLNISDFMWGTTYGVPVTLSFWMRTNLATNSVVCVTLRNSGGAYSYNAPVTVTASGSWQYVSLSVPAPPNGSTWLTDNLTGISLTIGGYGSATLSSSPNTWQAANNVGTTTTTNIWSTLNNYLEFTGVQLEKGMIATPFEFRPYGIELQLCQRYYVQVGGYVTNDVSLLGYGGGAGQNVGGTIALPVEMRIAGTATKIGTWATTNCGQPGHFNGPRYLYLAATTSGTGEARFQSVAGTAYYTITAEL